MSINAATAINDLMTAMREQGIETSDPLKLNGTLERFHVHGDRMGSTSGWAKIHLDSRPAGTFGCFKRYGDHKFSWKAKHNNKLMTAAELQAQCADWARRKAEQDAATAKRHSDAAERAQALWNAAQPAPDNHPYLVRKGVKAHGLRMGVWEMINKDTGEVWPLTQKALYVPLCDKTRAVHSLQGIFPSKILGKGDGARDKDYLKDGAKRGLFHAIGKPQQFDGRPVFIICEGYATGATIHEETDHLVLVAFDTSNLLAVGEAIRKSKPDAIIIFAADNDQWTVTQYVTNPGLHYARDAAKEVGGLVALPPFAHSDGTQNEEGKWSGPTDFNDLRAYKGVGAVRALFEAVLTANQVIQDKPELITQSTEAKMDNASPSLQEDMPDNSHWPVPASTADEDDGAPAVGAISINGMSVMQAHDFPDLSAKLRPLNTIPNLAALMNHFNITARYNMIKKETELSIPGLLGTADNAQNVGLAHLNSLAAHCGLPRENLTEYVKAVADANAYNPVVEWIDSKQWDGMSRIQALADTLDCTNPEFRTLLVRRWLISCCASLVYRGFWTKGVLTLHGAQDLGKTSWFRRLVPANLGVFREGVSLDSTNKDSVMTAVSHWIVELGELESTLRRDMESLKAFISQKTDRLRRPYDRVDSEYPRRTVFCASVNSEKFLKDDTGNGRFWVITVEAVKHDHDIDMQQLWAEVMSLYRSGEQWHLTDSEKAQLNAGNEKFRQVSPFEELLTTNYDLAAPSGRWINPTLLLIEMGYNNPSKSQTTEVGQMLHRLGVEKRILKGRSLYRIPEKLAGSPSSR